jgi:hypothetical protein
MLIFISGTFWVPSGLRAPARSLQLSGSQLTRTGDSGGGWGSIYKVVFPVPFSPIMTMISISHRRVSHSSICRYLESGSSQVMSVGETTHQRRKCPEINQEEEISTNLSR